MITFSASQFQCEHRRDHGVVPIVGTYAFFCALGIFSNLIILYVLWDEHCKNKRKSASNSFILSLCAADTIQLAILPFKIDVRNGYTILE